MSALSGKTILILSPQSWGSMYVSKHHYAIALARRGNKVFFLNPPFADKDMSGSLLVRPSGAQEGLFIVDHKLYFPYWLKFHALGLFQALMFFQVKKILRTIGNVDIVWSFDLGNLYPFHLFGKKIYKVFHPVDEPLTGPSIEAAKGADIIFSVTREILQKYERFGVPKHFINHGLSDHFVNPLITAYRPQHPLRVGFAGNLLRGDIDREVLLEIVDGNPDCQFEFWGSYRQKEANIGGSASGETQAFLDALQRHKNVILHGAVSPASLAQAMQQMDAFLICYDVQRDQSRGTNYHKVMEYLSTGKVVVSNNITTYRHEPDLIQMIAERENNMTLPALFKKVLASIEDHNRVGLQQKRQLFALENTYEKQLDRIATLIDKELV